MSLVTDSWLLPEDAGSLTWDAGNAQNMGVAHYKLVHNGARLIGINDHNFTGGVGASADPHTAGDILCTVDLREKHKVSKGLPLWVGLNYPSRVITTSMITTHVYVQMSDNYASRRTNGLCIASLHGLLQASLLSLSKVLLLIPCL